MDAKQPSVGTSATGHGLHLSVRATGLTGKYRGESVKDGAERGDGGMHREDRIHASLDHTKETFRNRVVPWIGFNGTI